MARSLSWIIPLLILQALTLLQLPTRTNSQDAPLILQCPPDSNYTIPSSFKTDLDRLLSSLITSASSSPALFSNASLGDVYGLAQCRPDASITDCAACLNRSVSTFASQCLLRRSAATRFDLCLLRYSDRRFFSQLVVDKPGVIVNGKDAPDPSVFNQQLNALLGEISSEAPKSASRYAVAVKNSTQSQLLYGMVQCTRDLSVTDCARCLDEEVALFPTNGFGRVGAQIFRLSCTARFESYNFFSLSILPPPPPSPPPPPPPPPQLSPPGNYSPTGCTASGKKSNTTTVVLAVAIPLVVAVIVLLVAIIFCLWWRVIRKAGQGRGEVISGEYLMFDLGILRDATDNFSGANKLGEGGFGSVFKGKLTDGQEIAVKRLAGTSAQGLVELKNEVAFLAKLQHKNLVKLLGCCQEQQEKLLVYEYLPNTSLDRYLFDPVKRQQLDWARRFRIIEGVSRGLVYLHEDSRLKIIHRDLKASNILLDQDMNPRISDFGIAKLFDVDETHGSTTRIAGTYGYMAPEYAVMGHFSNKSDVYNFGLVVLEIVTGRKNSGFQGSGNAVDLQTYVWQHWSEGTALQLKDESLGDDFQAEQVLRCINIGLLCIQEEPSERPNMASVVLMLNSYLPLPSPSKPAFVSRAGGSMMTNESETKARDMAPGMQQNEQPDEFTRPSSGASVNDVSISVLEPR